MTRARSWKRTLPPLAVSRRPGSELCRPGESGALAESAPQLSEKRRVGSVIEGDGGPLRAGGLAVIEPCDRTSLLNCDVRDRPPRPAARTRLREANVAHVTRREVDGHRVLPRTGGGLHVRPVVRRQGQRIA